MKGKVISVFAGLGKTTVGKKYSNVCDLQSSPYRCDYSLIDKNDYVALGYGEKYYYVMRNNSITKKDFNEAQLYLIDASDEMCSYLSKYGELKNAIIRKKGIARISTLNRMINASSRNFVMEKKIRKEILEVISKYIEIDVGDVEISLSRSEDIEGDGGPA